MSRPRYPNLAQSSSYAWEIIKEEIPTNKPLHMQRIKDIARVYTNISIEAVIYAATKQGYFKRVENRPGFYIRIK